MNLMKAKSLKAQILKNHIMQLVTREIAMVGPYH
jgi:hypothetical protein